MGELIRSWLLLIVACHLIGAHMSSVEAANDANNKDSNSDQAQPKLPNPFISSDGGAQSFAQPIMKLVSQVDSMDGGAKVNQEEYLDLATKDHQRYAQVRNNTREVLLSIGGLPLSYRPYTCTVHKDTKVFNNELDDLTLEPTPERVPHIFGLLGIWLDATTRPHSYEFAENKHVYSVKRDDKLTVRLTFSEPGLSLRQVELIDSHSRSTLKSFRVLSFETGLEKIQEEVLEIPVGFDCSRALIEATQDGNEAPEANQDDDENFLDEYFLNARTEFKVSATKLNRGAQQAQVAFRNGREHSKWSDPIHVELAHSSMNLPNKTQDFGLLMTKIKSEQQDSRHILNHLYNVQYDIDSRQGICKMQQTNKAGENGTMLLKFSNGLELPFDRRQLVTLLNKKDKSVPIQRRVRRSSLDKGKQIEFTTFERPQFEWPHDKAGSAKRFARLMRTFSKTYSLQGEFIESRLESVTLWLVAPEQDWITEKYYFNLTKPSQFNSWLDVAETFDISEDCYLGDARKIAGQDFAWVELSYPISGRQMKALNENENMAKDMIYTEYMSSNMWTPFSMPRLELLLTREALVVRFLLLELPDLEPDRAPLLREQRLTNVLSKLRDQDFDLVPPEMSDELALPRSETGTGLLERARLITQYQKELSEFNQEHPNRVVALTWLANLQDQILIIMPNKCRIESDPSVELN